MAVGALCSGLGDIVASILKMQLTGVNNPCVVLDDLHACFSGDSSACQGVGVAAGRHCNKAHTGTALLVSLNLCMAVSCHGVTYG